MSMPIARRTLLAAATAAVLAIAIAPLGACRAGSLAQVDVYDRSLAETLPVYRHHGRQYVVGRPGNEYAIRIRNCTGGRLLAVVSVDGVNVVTGETASPDQSGYVLEPGGYVNIQGWRKDLTRTAAFYFSDPADSYAARTGRPADLGVIGVALFPERPVERLGRLGIERRTEAKDSRERAEADADAAQESTASRAAGATAPVPAMQQPSLGTGHGRGEHSPAERVEFERASADPQEMIAIRYERRETLVAMGVLPEVRYSPRRRDPDPFPGALGFVPDP